LALKQNQALDDIRHALGALQLAQNNFLKAQLSWKESAEDIRNVGRNPQDHPGIALQLEKQRAYHYLEQQAPGISSRADICCYTYRSYLDNQCFITPMLDKQTCQMLIDVATTNGRWTTNRHYAVPTNDIPIHTEPNLLKWFYPWMEKQCAPLMMKQFGIDNTNSSVVKQRLYVHDAFFVRYQDSKATNHLPCHCDECTHSFIICLNDDFEGGGTYFHDYNTTLSPKAGEVVSFKGDTLRHGGDAVTRGTRYIIAAFCYLDRCTGTYSKIKNESSSAKVSEKHHIPSVFHESKKQKKGFSFGFNVE
jgi:hypothetical protein